MVPQVPHFPKKESIYSWAFLGFLLFRRDWIIYNFYKDRKSVKHVQNKFNQLNYADLIQWIPDK